MWNLFYNSSSELYSTEITEDEEIFLKKIKLAEKLSEEKINDLLIEIGKSFIKTPYVPDTLDSSGQEALITNLHGLDCWTFFENTLVIARVIKKGKKTFQDYRKELEFIRYRGGKRENYTSRLHYFVDWIFDNAKKGVVKDINKELGGSKLKKKINFMTSHRDSYPALKSDKYFSIIKETEEKINSREQYYIPAALLPEVKDKLQSGDIIGFGTTIEGLDVTHTGFIYKEKGISYILDASSCTGYVDISDNTLYDYLIYAEKPGIIVARALEFKI